MTFTPADHLGAARRSLSTITRGNEELRLLTVERTYDAAPDEVWSALTTADRITRWLTPVSGDLAVGGRFQLEGNAGGEVLDCVPPERLAITWEYDGRVSWVDVSLRPTDGGTLLQLDHAIGLDDPTYADFGPGATGIGWEMALMGMALHLAAPEAPRPTDLPPMGDYFTASGTAWGEAAAAAGEDPEAARATARACIAAYSGE
jgi:uncharacterized protein YndB with AHSA1/START domain